MLNKLSKYGIKVLVPADARNSHLYNAYSYNENGSCVTVRTAMEIYGTPTEVVLRLLDQISKTNRNITTDI
jgi:hypothetical protein